MGQCILRDCGIEFEKIQGKKRQELEKYIKEVNKTFERKMLKKFNLISTKYT